MTGREADGLGDEFRRAGPGQADLALHDDQTIAGVEVRQEGEHLGLFERLFGFEGVAFSDNQRVPRVVVGHEVEAAVFVNLATSAICRCNVFSC